MAERLEMSLQRETRFAYALVDIFREGSLVLTRDRQMMEWIAGRAENGSVGMNNAAGM